MDEGDATEPSWTYKGWPHRAPRTPLSDVVDERLNIFGDDFLFPVATVSAADLEHNLDTMARFCRDHEVSLAPHAKTTMSPEIIGRQLDAGAWAITAATVSQAIAFREFGVKRILIAHQVVDPAAVRWIANELDAHPEVEIMCLVDSLKSVAAMNEALTEHNATRPIRVLVELGVVGGRSGCRTIDQAIEVAQAVDVSNNIRLVGVEGYEGMIPADDGKHAAVDSFLDGIGELAHRLDGLNLFDGVEEIILTAGGSMFPDRATVMLSEAGDLGRPARVVIRSGCYVTHDSMMYEDGGPFGRRAQMLAYPKLRAALMVWSYVVSRPEDDLAILGFGKRDASYDVDLPKPLTVRRAGIHQEVDNGLTVFSLNDQHAYVRVSPGFDLEVGDIVGCGVSHPCSTFDRWRALPLIDDDFTVVGAIRTYF